MTDCLRKKYIKVDKLRVKDACIKNLKVENADIQNAKIASLDVKDLFVNGRSIGCADRLPPVAQIPNRLDIFGATGFVGPTRPANVDPDVFDALIEVAYDNETALQARVAEGRNFINDYIASQGCPATCPAPPLEPVPLDIYGIMTLPLYAQVNCGPTGATGLTGATGATGAIGNIRANTAVNFNLQIAYLLEVAQSIDARLVSVLVQIAYVDTQVSGDIIVEEIFIANKQLYPTLDTLYGENFANTIAIPTSILQTAILNSPNPSNQGAIQMVIYREKGLCIWNPESSGQFSCLQTTNVDNSPAGSENQPITFASLLNIPLTLVSISPTSGPGGTVVTIIYNRPQGAPPITQVSFRNRNVFNPSAPPVECNDGQDNCQIIVVTPLNTPGPAPAKLENGDNGISNSIVFTYT
jgi:hypothetical protein